MSLACGGLLEFKVFWYSPFLEVLWLLCNPFIVEELLGLGWESFNFCKTPLLGWFYHWPWFPEMNGFSFPHPTAAIPPPGFQTPKEALGPSWREFLKNYPVWWHHQPNAMQVGQLDISESIMNAKMCTRNVQSDSGEGSSRNTEKKVPVPWMKKKRKLLNSRKRS